MPAPVKHLSFSAVTEYLTCRQLFYKKYVRWEFDSKTWLGTVIGNGVHFCVEQFYKRDMVSMEKLAEEYIADKLYEFTTGQLVLNDKGMDDETLFEIELRQGLKRCLPLVEEYIREKKLYDVAGAEVTYKLNIGPSVGRRASRLPLKAKIDLVTKSGKIIDWKVVKVMTGEKEPLKYTLQAAAYALAHAEHTGQQVESVTFVEILRTESDAEKTERYNAALAAWEIAKKSGEKVTKPRAPVLKDGGKVMIQEVVVPMTAWKLTVFLELFDRIERELSGENLVSQGLYLPAVASMYGDPEGWADFCIEVLGYNPYTGEVPQKPITEVQRITRPDLSKPILVSKTMYDPPLNVTNGETVDQALARQPHVEVTTVIPPKKRDITSDDLFF